MIVWLNGPFGAGKTTVAHLVRDHVGGCTVFDPELVGTMLDHVGVISSGDYQDEALWRRLVVDTVRALHDELGGTVVVPMTVLHEPYLEEVVGSLAESADLLHLVLHCAPEELRRRIDSDAVEASAATWRHYKLDAYVAAEPMLRRRCDATVDTTDLSPRAVRDTVLQHLRQSAALH